MKKVLLSFILFATCLSLIGQENSIRIKSVLNPSKDELHIQQEIKFINKSDTILKNIYLHNWANSYKSRKTPLSKRLVKDFRKDLYFADKKDIGYSTIKNLNVNFEEAIFEELENQQDIIKIDLKEHLQPNDSITISTTYTIKIPNAKFTGYGRLENGYQLRFWYMTPAVFDDKWQLMSNLNLDDLFEYPTDFKIDIDVPKGYFVESNLYQYETQKEEKTNYYLVGKKKTNVVLSINKQKRLKSFKTKNINIYTNVIDDEMDDKISTEILQKEIDFIEKFLGKYPHKEIFIDEVAQRKNPIYGLSQLPGFIRPFSDTFKWELTILKALSRKYLDNTLFLNNRKDGWFLDGLQNYLMIEYVDEFYPKQKLLGKYSKNWFLKTFNLSKLDFNDKYPLVYQFSARKFLDQSLKTSADSLSNLNRKVVNKYKAGLGFRYLRGYLGKDKLNKALEEFYQKNKLKITSSTTFEKLLTKKTNTDLAWFFGDYINSNKKIDYTIDKVVEVGDSLKVTIKNKRNITTPVSLYGVKDKKIKFKKWITNVDDKKVVTLPKGDFNKLALNYENLYPELNSLDNWKSLEKKIFNKPLKFSLVKDIQDPYYNQLFYQPNFSYNFYNGLILGVGLHNKPLIKRYLEVNLSPSYATKSQSLIGSFSVIYNQFFEKTNIYKIMYGMSGVTLDYAPNLSYKSLLPFVNVVFKRKDLRDATYEAVTSRILHIDKEVAEGEPRTAEDNYTIFNLQYNYINPDIIKEFRYNYNLEVAQNFSKVSADLRYRALTASDRQLDFRIFAGAFISNKTEGDYFSFGLDRANDYLFQLNYFGRSEESGFFSQQYIIAEGGFKSVLPTRFANQYMLSLNSSIGLWKWIEFYNDVAFLKNRNAPVYFAYNNGIRFNFVHNILEVYFPLYSNNGWEVTQRAYPQRIRFTLTAQLGPIFNFIRRGLF
ncbi:aminopeptidase [Polaribacter porphyrae]|uniref:Aminopeptidase n=1 Tax=Polaribacter porphyrae TaxID=1137780 RepID=A0A2S7WN39_9FLAO|nr:aminopeptidase [Polaribacter porphyrae]PQJ79020.1 aminopeptidase [Polaribacter porphyrae]